MLNFFKRKPKPPKLSDVSVSLPDWSFVGQTDTVKQWQNSHGDTFSVNLFLMPPDIGAELKNPDEVRSFYRQMLVSSGIGMIACDVVSFLGTDAVILLAKAPIAPTGCGFLASITIPFRDFSFVLKCQGVEEGMTGIRESVVMEKSIRDEVVKEEDGTIAGWAQDPYDPKLKYDVMRILADDQKWDTEFPDHPLSRARSFLGDLASTTQISQTVLTSPKFGEPIG